ncbi:MAG TPA: Ig-like domain-containing protein, partial [Gemmatimonadales bacterium]
CPSVRLSVLFVLSVLSCARMEPPPGGPPDRAPPLLLGTRPDSMARLPGFNGSVEFRFDEVISEGSSPNQGTGTGDLEKLIILSPSTRVPNVSWHRDRIEVSPQEGWKPDRIYRVELLPGVADLRQNRTRRGTVLTFSTGAPLPTTTLEGTVVDWSTSRPAPAALVEALLLPDSLPYRGLADSSGRFALGPLPAGQYLVSGVLDENHNLQPDPREAFDTVRLARGKTSAGELWAFVHDTTPPRIRTIAVADSLSATIELTQSLDPRQRLTPAAATVRLLPDSIPVKVTSLLPKPVDDSLHQRTAAQDTTARDTTARRRAPRDTTARDTVARRPGIEEVEEGQPRPRGALGGAELKPLTSRPPLSDQLVLRVARPWKPDGRYVVDLRGIRNVTGVAGEAQGVLAVPAARAADSLGRKPGSVKADSLKADSLARRPARRP